QICFGIDDDTTWNPDIAACSSEDFYDGNWHHLLAMRDATATDKIYLYIDGMIKGSTADSTTATLENDLSFYIGDRDGTDNGDEFTGDIDEMKIYRTILTPQQILTEMNQGKTVSLGANSTTATNTIDNSKSRDYCVPGDSDTCTAPIGEWTLDEETGSTAYDTSGNNNNGTMNNSLWITG